MIPFIDILTDHVEKFKADTSNSPVVRAAASRGRIILDRYYSRTDEVAIYRVAMRTCFFFFPFYGILILTRLSPCSPSSSVQGRLLPRAQVAAELDR